MAFKPSVFIAGIGAQNIVTLVFNCLMCFKGDSGVKSDKKCKASVTIQTTGQAYCGKWGFENLKECVDFKFTVKIKTPTQSKQECVCINFSPGYHSFIRL